MKAGSSGLPLPGRYRGRTAPHSVLIAWAADYSSDGSHAVNVRDVQQSSFGMAISPTTGGAAIIVRLRRLTWVDREIESQPICWTIDQMASGQPSGGREKGGLTVLAFGPISTLRCISPTRVSLNRNPLRSMQPPQRRWTDAESTKGWHCTLISARPPSDVSVRNAYASVVHGKHRYETVTLYQWHS